MAEPFEKSIVDVPLPDKPERHLRAVPPLELRAAGELMVSGAEDSKEWSDAQVYAHAVNSGEYVVATSVSLSLPPSASEGRYDHLPYPC